MKTKWTLTLVLSILIFTAYTYILYEYPIMYADSGTYIKNAFNSTLTTNGSVAYPLYIKFISLNGYSLWLCVIFQNAILLISLLLILKLIFKNISCIEYLILIILLLPTSLPNYSNAIMTDVFLSISIILIIYLILSKKYGSKAIFGTSVLLFSIIAHGGYKYIIMLFLAAISFSYALLQKKYYRKIIFVSSVSLISILIFNNGLKFLYSNTSSSRVNFGSPYNRMIYKYSRYNLLDNYLKKACHNNFEDQYLCTLIPYIENYPDIVPNSFRGVKQSYNLLSDIDYLNTKIDEKIMKKIFWDNLFSKTFDESIIHIIISEIGTSLKRVDNIGLTKPGNKIYIKSIFSNDFNIGKAHSLLKNRSMSPSLKTIYNLYLYLSIFIALILMIILNKRINKTLLSVIVLISFFMIINHLFYSTFSNPLNTRYYNRLSWFIPFIAYCLIIDLKSTKQIKS